MKELLLPCLLFFGWCNVSTATRALVADLSKDASASQTGKPSGGNAHVGSCFVETRQSDGAPGEHCSGKLWLQRDNKPGNTGYYKFRNINGKGMIKCVPMPMHSCRRCMSHLYLSIINSLLSLLCRWNVNSELRVEGKAVQFILSTLNDTELDVALT